MIEIDVAIALMIGCFCIGYGIASRSARKEIEKLINQLRP